MKCSRWISLLLIMMLCLTMLASCKSGEEEELGFTDIDTSFGDKEENKNPSSKDPEENNDPDKDPTDDPDKDPADDPDDKDPADDPDKDPAGDPTDKDPADDPDKDPAGDPTDKDPADDPDDKDPADDPDDQPAIKPLVPMKKESSGTPITFVSQNIKHSGYTPYGEKGDGTSANIYNRLRRFKTMVTVNDPDIIFYNEAKETAKRFFNEDPYMEQTYDFVWQDRHSTLAGHLMSEPVLWKTAKFKELERGHFWISPTPDREGTGFGGQAGADVSTWVKLQVKKTGEIIYAYCLHTDPGNPEADIGAMQLYYDRFEKIEKDAYAFVGGDYNCYYRSETYLTMLEWDKIVDLRDVALWMGDHDLTTFGGMGSGHNLAFGKSLPEPSVSDPDAIGTAHQIDYVMMKPNPHVAIDHYGFDYTVYNYAAEGIAHGHISDHWGLVVKVRINTEPDYSQYQQAPYEFGDKPRYFNFDMKYYNG